MRAAARLAISGIAALLASSAPAAAGEVGFATVSVPDPPGADLKVGVWYPTDAAASEQELGLFTQEVAPDAPVSGAGHPLIVMSHGAGGSMDGHYDTALALAHAGFVAAAPTHTGDNFRDRSRAARLAERSRAVHAVIGWMLEDWSGKGAIDPAKVGVFGFSAGGFTALAAAGGVPDMSTIRGYCDTHEATYVCEVSRQIERDPSLAPAEPLVADPRIKAAVVAAPAVGFAFKSGLKGVTMPVQLWQAGDDRVLPAPDYVEPVRDGLPQPPEFHLVPGAGHFDFLAPCSEALARIVPLVCQEEDGFDRAAFHREFDADVVRFFKAALDG